MHQTTFEEVLKIAGTGDYKLIPVVREILSDIATPVQVMRKLKNVSDHCFLLESVEDSRQWGRYSFLGYNPTMEISLKEHKLYVTDENGEVTESDCDAPGAFLKELVEKNKSPRLEGMPTFTGGLVGYFSYDYMQYAEKSLKFKAQNEYDFSDMDLMLFENLIVFDNLRQKIVLISNAHVDADEAVFKHSYDKAVHKLGEMEDIIVKGEEGRIEPGKLLEDIHPVFSKEEYCEKVRKTKQYIVDGDIFQLVLSNPMEAAFEGSLFDTYRILRTTNPSPYMFYFSGDTEIAGASPETLVKVEDGVIRTFPLAGTRPRGTTYEEDQALEKELLADEKEKAEHNMLVDLGRNDLGRLCEFGSVEVEKYMGIERYSHVMHIGSSVKGKLSDKYTAVDAVDSVLPAGTLSGAPKIRACQLIDELEGIKRGIYGGAIGYVDFTGNLDTCIAIRLAYKKNGKVFVRSGAGIVADSVPETEFTECVNKAKAVVNAIKASTLMDKED
ncbi:anthranilate synthase component I [Butyrivibrio sp. DSM 10294]|uniref:anthranilate synthase component I n=1 Tax=Butyrivibrio sp. DSM 10294 TaxID=2972457 RepID=UPI00234E3BE5|nr:anthranilate synthase component I [Butyrivibrio sp. DSM 10294]MDC7293887.1 anthranilate synthase component I [Butyrivibrio sp. DSM 10294]